VSLVPPSQLPDSQDIDSDHPTSHAGSLDANDRRENWCIATLVSAYWDHWMQMIAVKIGALQLLSATYWGLCL
jgi:hypothetical protein